MAAMSIHAIMQKKRYDTTPVDARVASIPLKD